MTTQVHDLSAVGRFGKVLLGGEEMSSVHYMGEQLWPFDPTMVRGGRDLFWWSMHEAAGDGDILDRIGGGRAAALGEQIANVLPSYQEVALGPELLANTSPNFNISQPGNGAYNAGINVFAGKTYLVDYTISANPGTISATWRGNGSSAVVPPGQGVQGGQTGAFRFIFSPTGTAALSLTPDNTSVNMTIATCSVKEVVNAADFALLTQATGNLRPLLGRRPVTGVRNLAQYSEDVALIANQLGGTGLAPVKTPDYATLGGKPADRIQFNLNGGTTVGDISRLAMTLLRQVAIGEFITIRFKAKLVTGTSSQLVVQPGFYGSTSVMVTNLGQTFEIDFPIAGAASNLVWFGARGTLTPNTIDVLITDFEVVPTADKSKAYQRVGANDLDVTEAGVSTIYFARYDLNDDRMGMAIPAKKNAVRYPETFDAAMWGPAVGGTGVAPTVTRNFAEGPVSGSLATRCQFNLNGGLVTNDYTRLTQAVTLAVAPCANSIWVRATDGVSNYQMHMGNPDGSSLSIAVSGEWQRIPALGTGAAGPQFFIGLRGGQNPVNSNTADVLIARAQAEINPTVTDFEGDIVGTGIVAGGDGIWVENVRNPRKVAREVQSALSTGLLLPGSPVLGLPELIHGIATDANRGLNDILIYDRILSEAEIAPLCRFLQAAGAGGRWKYQSRILDENFGSYADTPAMQAAGWSGVRDAVVEQNAGSLKVTQGASTFPSAVKSLVGSLVAGQVVLVRAALTAPVVSYAARAFIGDPIGSTAYSLIATAAAGTTQIVSFVFLVTPQAASDGRLTIGTNGVLGTVMSADNITVDTYVQEAP